MFSYNDYKRWVSNGCSNIEAVQIKLINLNNTELEKIPININGAGESKK